ncbi:hypothetical protein K2173_003501 [Erythroxylum novogranatense]|uniref:Lil3 protein n=1 Tax=Erythroxylum novogranatense TaxID=1862640 RepID=A0AAV8TBN7_9ROSI|nr:hypothetical protein K2173_003501 [Erythroxylum novogranatense]
MSIYLSTPLFSPLHLNHLSRSLFSKTHFAYKPLLLLRPSKPLLLLYIPRASADIVAGNSGSAATVDEPKIEKNASGPSTADVESSSGPNGVVPEGEVKRVTKFEDPRWVGGTWDLKQFQKDGSTDWDAVIDAEVRRRKWLESNPETTSNDDPIVFDTSIIPWWAWMKRFHLPEAELLNGRAAMIGFFMAYLVDSLTGVGLVDQMSCFFCKTLLFVAVVGVLLIRKNEDIENLKQLLEETTFYDRQWQATWQDETSSSSKKN